ncbi:hypothetical protein LX77_00118 [Gelidibacter algens]|uniref:Uncharacterized protein n=1 Tax=Gelidibacter algens TaxID=49280 RepID=A0A327SEV7_9FLAO|nr:hypothetical protein LX77_00118 [Gelidibacter algens]
MLLCAICVKDYSSINVKYDIVNTSYLQRHPFNFKKKIQRKACLADHAFLRGKAFIEKIQLLNYEIPAAVRIHQDNKSSLVVSGFGVTAGLPASLFPEGLVASAL